MEFPAASHSRKQLVAVLLLSAMFSGMPSGAGTGMRLYHHYLIIKCKRLTRIIWSAIILGEEGWRSGESTRLPPMWPWFDSQTRRHMWVEFVVGSRPCSEGFSPVLRLISSHQKTNIPNSNSIWNQWTNSHSVDVLLQISIYLFIYFFYMKMTSKFDYDTTGGGLLFETDGMLVERFELNPQRRPI